MLRSDRKREIDSSQIRSSHLSIYDQLHQARSAQVKKAKPEVEEIDILDNDQTIPIESPEISRKREVEDHNSLHISPHSEYEILNQDRAARGKKSKPEEVAAIGFQKFPAVITTSTAVHWKRVPGLLKQIVYEEEMLNTLMQSLTV